MRQFFKDCVYVGLDCTGGPMVDVVGLAHEHKSEFEYGTIISCEAFEHDPFLSETINTILRLLRPGGLFVGTWASPTRQEHGTVRSSGASEIYGPDPNYYKGISPEEFLDIVSGRLEPLQVEYANGGFDVYAVGFKK